MECLPVVGAAGSASALDEVLKASVTVGGKRLRPLVTLCIADALGGDERAAIRAAVAAEYVHTSSLIVDDLPMMDDSSVRRGCQSLHVRFGEAVALLAALALLNEAYVLALGDGTGPYVELHRQLARCVGGRGMIRGQFLDLAVRERSGEMSDARALRSARADVVQKTASLFRFSVLAGGLCARAPASCLRLLGEYGDAFGTAFQMRDDIEDADGDGVALEVGDARWRRLDQACGTMSRVAATSEPRVLRKVLVQLREFAGCAAQQGALEPGARLR